MLSPTPIFVGIDVACARKKRLPVCVARLNGGRLEPVDPPPEFTRALPLGRGNDEIRNVDPFKSAAVEVAETLDRGAKQYSWNILSVAVDAPAASPKKGERASERALRECSLSSFQTPDEGKWCQIRENCENYLQDGGALNRIPHANKIWMLYGFEIFKALRAIGGFEVIEVYPYAIVRTLLSECPHKTTPDGYKRQLESVANATNWTPLELECALKHSVAGSKHDKLDAFMAAWVASLCRQSRRAFGNENDPDDAIWVPREPRRFNCSP